MLGEIMTEKRRSGIRPTSDRTGLAGGFTLIELLVVVVIIALLVSVLLPAVNTARKRARSSYCLSDLKELGLATLYYAGDYGDYLPTYGVPGGSTHGILWNHWKLPERLEPFLSRAEPKVQKNSGSVWQCPSDKKFYGRSSMGRIYTSYMVDAEKTAYGKMAMPIKWLPYKITDYPGLSKGMFEDILLREPSREALYADLAWVSGRNRRHNGGYNVVFIDWHVKWYREVDRSDMNYYVNRSIATRNW